MHKEKAFMGIRAFLEHRIQADSYLGFRRHLGSLHPTMGLLSPARSSDCNNSRLYNRSVSKSQQWPRQRQSGRGGGDGDGNGNGDGDGDGGGGSSRRVGDWLLSMKLSWLYINARSSSLHLVLPHLGRRNMPSVPSG